MNTCGTCKYFGEVIERDVSIDGDEYVPVTRMHKCMLLEHLNKDCGNARFLTATAGVIDGSGYHATFCVSEEFGCNQWVADNKEAGS